MRLLRRSATLKGAPIPVAVPIVDPATASASPLVTARGDQYCSARGCAHRTGLACSYIDRRERPCPTAWCPEHRHVTHGAVFCPAHARLLDSTGDEFHPPARVDLGNAAPAVLAWAVQEVDAEVSSAMLQVAMEWHQALVLDPVHFGLAGAQRVRTWERAWKVCDNVGPTLRVSVTMQEARPGVVEGRINAQPVVLLSAPWHESHGVGQPPATRAEARAQALEFRERLLVALIRGIAEWRRDNLGSREPLETSLRGTARGGARAAGGAGSP